MNVLVTGIDGFVGSHLADALIRIPGIHIWGLVKDFSTVRNLAHIQNQLTLLQCDIHDLSALRKAFEQSQPERIFHLAGQAFVPNAMRDPLGTFQTNINGTIHVLEAARQLKLTSSILVVSSGEVYGWVETSRLPIDETFPLNPCNPYAASKASADLLAQEYRRSFGLKVVVARPFNHLGPRQSDLFVGSAFAKQVAEIVLKKRPPCLSVGNLDPKRDFTDVRDVVQAYNQLLQEARADVVYNVCSGEAVPIRDILSTLRALSGIDFEIRPDPERQRKSDIPVIIGSSIRLQKTTGWRPRIPLRDTLRDLLQYWIDTLSHSGD